MEKVSIDFTSIFLAICTTLLSLIIRVCKSLYSNFENKVKQYIYINLEVTFLLFEYELIGSMISQIIVLILTVIFGVNSDWYRITLIDYVISNVFVFSIYLFIDICIMVKWRENEKFSYSKNIFLSIAIYLVIFGCLCMDFVTEDYPNCQYFVGLIIIVILIRQFQINIDKKQIKRIKYIVYTKTGKYITFEKPIYKDKYLLIRIKKKNSEIKEEIQLAFHELKKVKHVTVSIDDV